MGFILGYINWIYMETRYMVHNVEATVLSICLTRTLKTFSVVHMDRTSQVTFANREFMLADAALAYYHHCVSRVPTDYFRKVNTVSITGYMETCFVPLFKYETDGKTWKPSVAGK